MGLILDSSLVIAAERRGDTVEQLIARIIGATGDQGAALSAIGLTELMHGIFRAKTPEMRRPDHFPLLPTAYAVGFILLPLRGWKRLALLPPESAKRDLTHRLKAAPFQDLYETHYAF